MKNNIIDLSERTNKPETKSRFKDLKLRIDLEQAKLLISTSLISVLFLATFANNNLMKASNAFEGAAEGSAELSSKAGGRGPDAVITGTSDMEDAVVHRLAKLSLNETSFGRSPTALEKLTLGTLEGKYAVRLDNGKLHELEFSDTAQAGDQPKYVEDRVAFLTDNRSLLPVDFDKMVKVESNRTGDDVIEIYDLVDAAGIPLAKARFMMDGAGRLKSLKVIRSRVASR